jgi:hypothetical protein
MPDEVQPAMGSVRPMRPETFAEYKGLHGSMSDPGSVGERLFALSQVIIELERENAAFFEGVDDDVERLVYEGPGNGWQPAYPGDPPGALGREIWRFRRD